MCFSLLPAASCLRGLPARAWLKRRQWPISLDCDAPPPLGPPWLGHDMTGMMEPHPEKTLRYFRPSCFLSFGVAMCGSSSITMRACVTVTSGGSGEPCKECGTSHRVLLWAFSSFVTPPFTRYMCVCAVVSNKAASWSSVGIRRSIAKDMGALLPVCPASWRQEGGRDLTPTHV